MFPPQDLTGVNQTLLRSTDDSGVLGGTSRTAQHCHKNSGETPSTTLIGRRQILNQTQHYVLLDHSAVAPGTIRTRQKASSSSLHLLSMASNASTPTQSTFPSSHVSPETSLLPGEYPENVAPTTSSHTAGGETDTSWLNTLPNQRLKFDLQSLNLHLSTRVTEILACAEAMWEWLCEFQDSQRPHRGQQPHIHKEHSLLRNVHPAERIGTRKFSNELTGLSRPEFDVLLTRFELCVRYFLVGVRADDLNFGCRDMRDCIDIEARITSACHAPAPMLPLTNERKAFDNACEKWEEYQIKQREKYTTGVPTKDSIDPSAAGDGDGEAADSTGQRLSRTIRVFCAWKAS